MMERKVYLAKKILDLLFAGKKVKLRKDWVYMLSDGELVYFAAGHADQPTNAGLSINGLLRTVQDIPAPLVLDILESHDRYVIEQNAIRYSIRPIEIDLTKLEQLGLGVDKEEHNDQD